MAEPLWKPSEARVAGSQLQLFARQVVDQWGTELAGFDQVHRWSVRSAEQFWTSAWEFAGVVGERGAPVIEPGDEWWRARFFPDAELNFAENLLPRSDDSPAVIAADELGTQAVVSWAELRILVARIQEALVATGVDAGDRVAAWLPNGPECVALMLASTGLGAIFTSCSPDFGSAAVIDRFGQIEPTVLVGIDHHRYDGTIHDNVTCLRDVMGGLPSVRRLVVVPGPETADRSSIGIDEAVAWDDWLAPHGSGATWSSGACPSTTRSTSSTRRARRVHPSASCTEPAGSC